MRPTHNCNVYIDHDLLDRLYEELDDDADDDDVPDYPWKSTELHCQKQDETTGAWQDLLELIDNSSQKNVIEFEPAKSLGWEKWSQIITLPKSIEKLQSVKQMNLYGSRLQYLPPELGKLIKLKSFVPYTSYGLHWFPYEISKCLELKKSSVSTRALYGNNKYRPPFPKLNTNQTLSFINATSCSICEKEINQTNNIQAWHSLEVATDVLPLLINACSQNCIDSLPQGCAGYTKRPHSGGMELVQPTASSF